MQPIMMKAYNLLLLFFSVLSAFFIISCASMIDNHLNSKSFNTEQYVEDTADTRNYLVKTNNEKVYGEKITGRWEDLVKDRIKIDDQEFKPSEIIAYRRKNTFFLRIDNRYPTYASRIVHGKLNVYTNQYITTSGNNSYQHCDYYVQNGEDSRLTLITTKESIIPLMRDCPKSLQMLSVSNEEFRKAIKQNKNYLNQIFELDNNGCR
jgi:hypothetical protein